MTPDSALSKYKESVIESAPPLKIVRLMYEGATRFLRRAEEAPESSPERRRALQRADAIVVELRCALDHEQGGDLARQLEALYLFVEGRIAAAHLENSKAPLASARTVLEKLLDGWNHVEAPSER